MKTGFGIDVHDGKAFTYFHDEDRNKCKDGEIHIWSEELRDDMYGGQSVFCRKCNVDMVDISIWE